MTVPCTVAGVTAVLVALLPVVVAALSECSMLSVVVAVVVENPG
jgi:hypothetical protein